MEQQVNKTSSATNWEIPIGCVQLELRKTRQQMILHDDAPAHCAIRARQFLAQRGLPC